MILQSILIGFSFAAIPGPVVLELIRRTLTKGFSNGALLALGAFTGTTVLLAVIFTGASSLLNAPAFKPFFFFLTAALMGWLAFNAWKVSPQSIEEKEALPQTGRHAFLTGLGIALTNPIDMALWAGISASYLAGMEPVNAYTNILFIGLGFPLFQVPLAGIVHFTRKKIPAHYLQGVSRLAGIILLAYALNFAFQGIRAFS
ncbi:MAG: LysE family transporter, partial [Candidatus Diapherotrites archaeon]|nr:LysE family transporter [Candidatus Diapherotrites archaeon]